MAPLLKMPDLKSSIAFLVLILTIRPVSSQTECGGLFEMDTGSIQYPSVDGIHYPDNIQCNWIIRVSNHRVINLYFTRFDLENNVHCRYDFLQINNTASLSIGKYCGNSLPNGGRIVSKDNTIHMLFTSDISLTGSGFQLHWDSSNPNCGGILEGLTTGTISSPGYPDVYSQDTNCVWTIQVTTGNHILLSFTDMPIETHNNCNYDWLEIRDGLTPASPLLTMNCTTSGLGPIQTTRPYAYVRFESGISNSDRGFQITYSTVFGPHGCGRLFEVDTGSIQFPPVDEELYNYNTQCNWTIRVPSDKVINLYFTSFSMDRNCGDSFLQINDISSSNALIGKFCGEELPNDGHIVRTGSTIFIEVQSEYNSGGGFQLNWESSTSTCGGIEGLYAGAISSPGYPDVYSQDTDCVWTIQVTTGNHILLSFTDMPIETHNNCNYDWLEIRDGMTPEEPLLNMTCTTSGLDPIHTSGPYAYVRFQSGINNSDRGFEITYSTFVGTEECGGLFETDTGSIQYPPVNEVLYSNNVQCSWIIHVPSDKIINLYFTMFDLEPGETFCGFDFLQISNGDSSSNGLIGKYCGDSLPNGGQIVSTGNTIYMLFKSDGSETYSGFQLNWRTSYSINNNTNTRLCDLLEMIEPCDEGKACVVINNMPQCKENELTSTTIAPSETVSISESDVKTVSDSSNPTDGISPSKSVTSTIDAFSSSHDIIRSFIDPTRTLASIQLVSWTVLDENTTSASIRATIASSETVSASESDVTISSIVTTPTSSGTTEASRPAVEETTTPEPTRAPVASQEVLFPYGVSQEDSSFNQEWPSCSERILFKSRVPYGKRGFSEAYVLLNGVISFGSDRSAWNLDFSSAQRQGKNLVAVFWTWMTYYEDMTVYYHLYEQGDETTDGATQAILTRATEEVTENYGNKDFVASTVMVATWEKAKPDAWYGWICKYYQMYQTGWSYYDRIVYTHFCLSAQEQNTFQAVFVTDGRESFVIRRYKQGEMNWRYDLNRDIEIGFVSDNEIVNYNIRGTTLTLTLDIDNGNYREPGMYLDKVGDMESSEAECRKFYQSKVNSTKYNQTYLDYVEDLFDCPCTLSRLGAQWWWYNEYHVSTDPQTYVECYALSPVAKERLERINGNPLNKMCCYMFVHTDTGDWMDWYYAEERASFINSGQFAGRVLGNDPWEWRSTFRSYVLEDEIPHRQCCLDSNMCDLFKKIRPFETCSTTAEFVTGRALGDPHIKTLDGKDYTMNGWGEYNLVVVEDEDFVLQGRTDRIVSNGKEINATVFVGFVAQENGVKFQAILNSTKNGMELTAGDTDITLEFYNPGRFEKAYSGNGVTVKKTETDNRITVQASFGSLITLSLHVGQGNIEFKLVVPVSLKGKLKGLLGNFNDDLSDEFILPDGTQLATNLTEKEIFQTFARKWQVDSSDSVFLYEDGELATDFRHEDFVPLFREDADPDVLRDAITTCGDATADACIFDYLATEDPSFAQATNQVNEEAILENTALANNLPTLTVTQSTLTNDRWVLNSGDSSTIQLIGADGDGDDITYTIIGDTGGQSLTMDENGLVTFTPDHENPIVLNFQVNDTKGGVSPVIGIQVAVCTDCNSHGSCDTSRTRHSSLNDTAFLLYGCNCLAAWSGEDCEIDINPCDENPCLNGQNCSDIPGDVQGNDPVGHTCGDCPRGYEANERDSRCSDTNECENNPCENGECENTQGSYNCKCHTGYTKDSSNKSLCIDIDECTQRIAGCDHECINKEGGYNCSCNPSYDLNDDGKSCDEQGGLPSECEACAHFCTVDGVTFKNCWCNTGYKVDPTDNTNCINVDECTEGKKPCSQQCTDLLGSFNCSCFDGFQLSSDGVTCEECPRLFFGANCASKCLCNGKGTCDSALGCVCNDGWTGSDCNTNINECNNNNPCDVGKVCVDTQGSYRCDCASGWQKDGEDCVDINECASVSTHTCDLSVENCENSPGTYGCSCKTGFLNGTSGVCEDINECDTGTHECEQLCENVLGYYNCKCRYGYRLLPDRKGCDQVQDICSETAGLNCDHVCVVDRAAETAECACNSGYYLETDGETCLDINECEQDHLNLCSDKETCSNKYGSFECSCSSGSKLENDGRTCTTCSGGKWGPGCSNDCSCGLNAMECDPKEGCKCKEGYTGAHCDEDIDECASGIKTCEGTTVCINTHGSAECGCNDGFVKDGTDCNDIDECTDGSHNCSQVCNNIPGGFVCSCYSGYALDSRSCGDVDECDLDLDGCQHECVNSNGGFACRCDEGYRLEYDGASCKPSEQCDDDNTCSHICARIGEIDVCSCPLGLTPDGSNPNQCIDADLCAGSTCVDICFETNDNTSIECACSSGYKLNGDGYTCTECVKGRYGHQCAGVCECAASTTLSCDKTTGTCNCIKGYEGAVCSTDENECETGTPCTSTANSNCVNTAGSFICQCNAGYKKGDTTCEECSDGFHGVECQNQCDCDTSHSTCRKTDGHCVCDSGWEGDRCDQDTDECDGTDSCTQDNIDNWSCYNLPGTYECRCDEGYVYNETHCENYNECDTDHTNQCDYDCQDTAPGYTCTCHDGFILNSTDNRQCHDNNECATNNGDCEHICNNEDGTYSCSCNSGYTLQDDGLNCIRTKSYPMKMTFDVDVSNIIFDPLHSTYQELATEVRRTMLALLKTNHSKVFDVIITKLSKGSLIVDAETIMDTSSDSDVTGEIIQALIELSNSEVTVNGQPTTVVVKLNNNELNDTSDRCALLEVLDPCEDDETCVVTDNIAECKGDDEDDEDNLLVMGLSVGLPLLFVILVLIVVVVFFNKKNKDLVRVVSRLGHYNDNISRPPSAKSDGILVATLD